MKRTYGIAIVLTLVLLISQASATNGEPADFVNITTKIENTTRYTINTSRASWFWQGSVNAPYSIFPGKTNSITASSFGSVILSLSVTDENICDIYFMIINEGEIEITNLDNHLNLTCSIVNNKISVSETGMDI